MTKRVACVALLVLGLVAIGGGWALAALNGRVADAGPTGAALTVAAVLGLLAGVALLRRHPDSWGGPFLQVVALTSFAGLTRNGLRPASPIAAGIWLATILLPGALALAHPDGIAERSARRTLRVTISVTAVLAPLIVLAAHGRALANRTWWQTSTVRPVSPTARALFAGHTVAVLVAVSAISAALVARAIRTDRASRRVTNPVAVPALVWAGVTAAGQLTGLAGPRWAAGQGGGLSAPATFLLQALPFLSIAGIIGGIAWVELIEPRLQRATVGLTVGADAIDEDVTAYLRRALADPSVTIFFRRADRAGWLDSQGNAAVAAFDDEERAITVIQRDGVEIGAIEYDAALSSQPDAVELTITAAALAIDSARFTAEGAARAEDSRRLAARLVISADSARDQLQRRLTDGPLVEMDSIDDVLASGDLSAAADRLQDVAAAVRNISHGLYPAELTDGGLAAVLTEAAAVPANRFPPALEVTAFLAADGDRGASITQEPGLLVIRLSRTPSDITLLDRVAALGGAIDGSAIILPLAG